MKLCHSEPVIKKTNGTNSTSASLEWHVDESEFPVDEAFNIEFAKIAAEQHLGVGEGYRKTGKLHSSQSQLLGACLWTETPTVLQYQQKRTCKVAGESNLSKCDKWDKHIYGQLPRTDQHTKAYLRYDKSDYLD